MTPSVVADQALLVLATLALAAAGLRLAWGLGARGVERALCAITLAAAAAGVEALALGLVGLGGDGVALTLAALATWTAVRAAARGPATGALVELLGWVRRAAPGTAVGVGAAAGVVVGWIAFQLRHPFIGGDGLIYHLPIASAWVQNGRPGSVVAVLDGLAVGNYPVTNEVLVAWGLGISRSWVVASIWSPILLAALVAGGWLALRELGVPAREGVLGTAAVAVLPLAVFGLGGPTTDLAATAWLAVCAGLAVAARRTPGLVYPAVLAAALCLGTKTTPALLVLALARVCAGPLRRAAAEHRGRLVAVLGLGVAIGGVWPLRNLVVHGSPLWPLVAAPWGDRLPAGLVPFQSSFLDHPRHLVGAHYEGYLNALAGGVVLMAGAIVLPLVRRSRVAAAAGAAAAAALLAWGAAPYTGIVSDDFAVGATRYLLPALGACAVAVALSARGAGPGLRRAVTVVFGAAIVWSCWRTAALGFPYTPSALLLGVAAGAGALAAATVSSSKVARRGLGQDRRLLAGALGVACVLGLSVAADGYVGRHALTGLPDGALLRAGVPDLANGTRPIATAPGTVVMLRGDRLEHKLSVIGPGETCTALRSRLREGPVVLQSDPPSPLYTRLTACLAGVAARRSDGPYDVYG